jgi:hypothetical protein
VSCTGSIRPCENSVASRADSRPVHGHRVTPNVREGAVMLRPCSRFE